MEHYAAMQTLNGHQIAMGLLQCLAVLVVAAFLAVKVFRSF